MKHISHSTASMRLLLKHLPDSSDYKTMKHQRLILGTILIVLLFSLMLYYSLDHNNLDPDDQYILDHFEQFNGTKVTMNGVVQNVDGINQTLLIELQQPPQYLILISTAENISMTQPGDVVEVYGTLTNRTKITAEKLLIFEQWKDNMIYLRSLLAIPFVLFLFFRSYRYNSDIRRFERRQKHG